MAKVKLSLYSLTPDETVASTSTIITAMTGNANFTTPYPTLANMTTLKNTLATKLAAYDTAVAASSTAMSERDAALAALRLGLTQLGAYVESITAGDRVKIESAGMSVRNESTPLGPMPQVLDLVVKASEFDGTLDLEWDPINGANCYELQSSVDPVTPTSWQFKDVSVIATASMNGLTSGSKIWWRVRAIGADNNKGPWSDPAAKTVP